MASASPAFGGQLSPRAWEGGQGGRSPVCPAHRAGATQPGCQVRKAAAGGGWGGWQSGLALPTSACVPGPRTQPEGLLPILTLQAALLPPLSLQAVLGTHFSQCCFGSLGELRGHSRRGCLPPRVQGGSCIVQGSCQGPLHPASPGAGRTLRRSRVPSQKAGHALWGPRG